MLWLFLALAGVVACLLLFVLLRGCGGAKEWVPATKATGDWTAGLQVFGPQTQVEETWQNDCQSAAGTVRQATCVLRPTGEFNAQPSDTYEEYAFNLYWEETAQQVYEAQGIDFVTTTLGGDERVEGGRRLVSQERLKQDTCRQTEYTVWANDPQNSSQEIEVYLYDCEVWNRVAEYDQVQAPWCGCEMVALVPLPAETGHGTGLQVIWPAAIVPPGGRGDQTFEGAVTFTAGDGQYSLAVHTQDPDQYRAWLTGEYYLGIKDGRAVQVTDNPPK
jgi:hypothetical protein